MHSVFAIFSVTDEGVHFYICNMAMPGKLSHNRVRSGGYIYNSYFLSKSHIRSHSPADRPFSDSSEVTSD